MTTNPNAAAYPCDSREAAMFSGLTKREYFAAMAMQGICANASFLSELTDMARKLDTHTENVVACVSVELARALIAELNKEEK